MTDLVLRSQCQAQGSCHNTWAIAVFRYFFAQVKWPDRTLVQLDILTHKIMNQFKAHHYCASVECLYPKRISRGSGLVNICQAYEQEVVASGLYLVSAVQDELLQAVMKHQLHLTHESRHNNLQAAVKVLEQYPDCTQLAESVWQSVK